MSPVRMFWMLAGSVNGHRFLPSYGHRFSPSGGHVVFPLVAIGSPQRAVVAELRP